jgi:hypothetical protein
MTQREDDLFGDEPDREAMDEFERMRELLHARISEFADEHDVPDGMLSALLLDLAVTARMMDYTLSVEQREIADFVRDCKRHADEFIEHSKDAVAQARAELEAEEENGEAESGRSRKDDAGHA